MTKRLEQADDRTEELLPDLVSGFTSAIERSEWDRARDENSSASVLNETYGHRGR